MPTKKDVISLSLLRAAFTSEHVPTLITGVTTHNAALQFIGQTYNLANSVERITEIVVGALPESYAGNTIKEIPEMVASAIKKWKGKRKEKSKKEKPLNQATLLVSEVLSSNVELFHSSAEDGYISWPLESGGRITHRIGSTANSLKMSRLLFKKTGTTLRESSVSV
jgi:hypothetical protein